MARLALTSEPVINNLQFLLSALLLTLHLVSAGPTGQRSTPQCVSFCKETKNFLYEPGTTYVYDYATDIRTSVIEGSGYASNVRVTARVEVESVSLCNLKLQLKNVNVEDLTNGPSEYTELEDSSTRFRDQKHQLELHSLVFGFQDGKVEQICAHQDDDSWVLNVKRGIVSMIQNSLDDLTSFNVVNEIDINGRCPTEYILDDEPWGGGITFRKIKDLSKCTSRQTQLSGLQSASYGSNSPIQSIPLLTGKLECLQTVRNKKIEKVNCQEEQKFQPFEQNNSGATATIIQTLDFVSEYNTPRHQADENGVFVKKSLLFEAENVLNADQQNSNEVFQILQTLQAASFPQVTKSAPGLFVDFVEELRKSNEASVRTVFDATFGTSKEKYVLEALPLVGTASSLAILRDLTLQSKIQPDGIKGWLTALAFIKHPSLNMIRAVAPLLQEDATMEAILGISSLINSYCKYHPTCNQDVVVNEVLEKYTSYLGNSCRPASTNAADIRQMVLRLKAIGNAGMLPVTEEVSKTPVIIKCLKDATNPVEIRLAAIDSLRRLSCLSYDSQDIFPLFTNMHENTEVRIKAFLTLMRCANRHTVEVIKSVLFTESVNQVASFVWTYLTNIQETNRPEKQDIRNLVSNEHLKNKFSTDARKFSRNYESSTYWENWNVGAGLDSNVIFTEESFLPKSGMFNMSLQFFGESVNILEFGLRAHGMEQLLEKVFGPQGYFPDTRVTDFLDASRVKRDVSSNDDTEGLGYLYDQAKSDDEHTPGGSFYTRMFGHEILYKNFEISDETSIPNVIDENGKNWFDIRSVLDNLSTGKKSEFSKSMILLDTSYSVATSSGFPLSLGVHAAATMALVAKGKFNVGKYLETKELDVQGTLKPSTMIDVDGTLAITIGRQKDNLRTGLKLHNTLRSSTAVEVTLLVKGKNVLHASLNVPQTKQEIIDVSSELILLGPKGQVPLVEPSTEDITDYTSNACTSKGASDIVGMRLCTEMNIPAKISFTPVRPTFLRVYLEKTDDFSGYTLDYRYDSDHSSTKLSAVFDTPGSRINRRLSGDFLLDKGMGKIAGGLESVTTSLKAEGIYTQFQKNLELSLTSQEKTTFLLSTGIRNDGNIVKPHFLITWYSQPLVDLKGTIDLTPQSNNEDRIAIEMNLKHLTETPVKVVGEIKGSGEVKEATLSIESYILTGNVRSQLRRKAGHWSTKTSMEYSWKKEKMYSADLSAKLQRTRKGSLARVLVTAGFSSTQFPDNNLDFLWETQTSYGFCENTLNIKWGKTSWEGHTLFSRQNQVDHSELRFESSLKCSKYEVDYRLEFSHRANTEGFNTKFLGRVSPDAELNSNIEYISAVNDLLKKSLEASATWPNTEYSFKASFLEKQRGEFEAELLVQLNNIRDLKATALYINKSNNLKLDHNVEFRARGFTSVPISGSIGFSATEKQSHIGCQIQFEGRKPYSSRISTSIDYSHTKYSHKIEGKVTLNEKKYNGEIFYFTNRTGAKNLLIDLQLENRIVIEGSLTGMLPEPMLATLSITPDKDNEPESMMKMEGNLDLSSVALSLNYFDDEMFFAGRYDESSVHVELGWPEDNKFVVAVAIPKVSFAETQLELDISTPFEGYRTIEFSAQYSFDGENLKTNVKTGIENSSADLKLTALVSAKEVSISTDLDVSGYPKYQTNILVLRKPKRKSFQIAFKSGDKESLLDFDFIRLDEGYLGKLDFHGCKFLPEISIELNHQFSPSHISSYLTKFQWAAQTGQPQTVVLNIKGQHDPVTIEATFTSPWNPVKLVEGAVTWDPNGERRQIALTLRENLQDINSKIELQMEGNLQDFRHEMTAEWFTKTMQLTASGGINGISDSSLHTIGKLPQHHISLDLLSKKETDKYIGEFRTELDEAVTSGGIKWDFTSEITTQKVASIWGESPIFSPSSATFEYENNGRTKQLKAKVISNNTSLLDMDSQAEFTGLRFWNIKYVLISTIQYFPSISLETEHSMMDINNIRHTTSLSVTPLPENEAWFDMYVPARQLSLELAIDNVEDIKGTAIVGDKDFVVSGKIQQLATGYSSNMKIASNSFHELNFQGMYTYVEDTLGISGSIHKHDGETLLRLQLEYLKRLDEENGKFQLESKYTPSFEGYLGVGTQEQKSFSFYLLKNGENLFTLSATGLLRLSVGTGKVSLTSARFPSIAKLGLSVEYRLDERGLNGHVQFEDESNTHSAAIESAWEPDTKRIKASYEGLKSVSFEATLENMNQLSAQVNYDGRTLGGISISYRPEQSNYSFGKHGVYIQFTDGNEANHDFVVVMGLDTKKVLLNVQTPFTNWTNVIIDGQMASTTVSKKIKFLLQRENESIKGSFDSKNMKKSGTLEISSELTVDGFTNIRKMLLETAQATHINGLSAVDPQKFSFQLNWLASNFNVKVETPVDVLKKIAFAGNWELKKPQKFIEVTGEINERQYELKADYQLDASKFNGKLSFQSDDSYLVELVYNFSSAYETHLTVESPNQQWNIGAKVSVKENELSVELETPIKDYEYISTVAKRNFPSDTERHYSLSWSLNGKSDKVEIQYSFEQGRVELRLATPIKPWNSVVVTVIYDNPFQRLTFHSQRGDGKEVKLNLELESVGNITLFQESASTSVRIAIETPVENFENVQFALIYDRQNLAHEVNMSVIRNSGEAEGKLTFKYQQSQPVALDISAYMTSPYLSSKATAHASLVVDPSGESTVSAHVQANGRRYEMYGLSQFTARIKKLEMRTTLPFLRQLKFSMKSTETSSVHVIWTGNNKQVEIHGDVLCGGLKSSRINFNVSTPVDIIGSFGFEGEITTKAGATSGMVAFQNHEVRWLAKVDRLLEAGKDDWRLQVNTPLTGYKHVVVSVKHLVSTNERNIVGAIQLNKKDMSMKVSMKDHQLNMVLTSQLAYLPVQAKIESDWEKDLNLKVSANAGSNDYGTTIKVNLDGVSQGSLDFAVSSLHHLQTRLDWKFQGDLSEGQGRVNLKNPFVGSTSMRSSWKHDHWKVVQAQAWMSTGEQQLEKGIAVQYTVTPHNHYGSIHASANYTFTEEPKSIEFDASIDMQGFHMNFDSVLKTQFDELQTLQIKGQLTVKPEIELGIDATLNDQKIITTNMNLFVNSHSSGIILDLDVPQLISFPLTLDASFDLTTENKLLSVKFEQGTHLVDMKLTITMSTKNNIVDVNLQADSSVRGISGKLRLEFAVSSDGTRQLSVHLTSEQIGDWKLLTTIQLSANFHTKVVFESPLVNLPTFMLEFNIKGNNHRQAEVETNLTIILKDTEITGNVRLNKEQWRSSFKCSMNSPMNCDGEAVLNFHQNNANMNVRFNQGQHYSMTASGGVNITSDTKRGSGILTITSGQDTTIPMAIEIVATNNGNIVATGSVQEQNMRLEAYLKGVNGRYWFEEGETGLLVEKTSPQGDTNQIIRCDFNHFFRSDEYSVNGTVGAVYQLESYLKFGRDSRALVNFNNGQLSKLDVKINPSSVDAYVHVPAWVKVHFISDYGKLDNSGYINTVLHAGYEQTTPKTYTSVLNATYVVDGNQTLYTAFLDVPYINQKVNVQITTVINGPQNYRGKVSLKTAEQEMIISGNLKSQVFDSTRGERYVERVLQLSGNVSSTDTKSLGVELFIRKPQKSFSTLSVISTISINDKVTTVSGGYELPTTDSPITGIYFKLQNSDFALNENYEFFIKAFGNGLRKLEGKLNYRQTRFDILWDLVMPTSVISVSLSGNSDEGDRLLFQVESIVNPNENVKFSLNCHCWDTHYTFRTSLTRSQGAVTGYLYVNAPSLLASTNEYKISIATKEEGSYTLEASAIRGRLILELTGDAAVTSTEFNCVLKAIGSYGSHYAMINGNYKPGEYLVELTAESSSLLIGKRVHIRGTVDLENGFNAVIQCRARRNIHELTLGFSSENGSGKLLLNLDSPSMDPAKFETEWTSEDKNYFGKLFIQGFQKIHQSEFGINLKNFEGKLHIISPLLPSNEFNLHLKSIVNSQNFDVLGDLRIRGSHWRLEGVASFMSLWDMAFKLETRTPFEFLDRITFGIKCNDEEIYLEVHTPATYIPNIMFKLGGIQALEKGAWHKLKPNLVVSVPNGKYSAIGSLEIPNYDTRGLVHVLLQYEGKDSQTLEAYSEISPFKAFKLQMESSAHFEIRLHTPFNMLRRVRLHTEGEISSKRSGKLQVTGYLNTYDGQFDASFDNSNGNMQASTRLITNIPNYEKSAFAIAIQTIQGIGQGKTFHVEFSKPNWKNLFRLDADYRYQVESWMELEGEVNVNMASYMNLPPFHAQVKTGTNNGRHNGAIEAKFGSHHPSLKFESENLDGKVSVIIEGKAGAHDRYNLTNTFEMIPIHNQFSIREKLFWSGAKVLDMKATHSDSHQLVESYIEMSTPWGPIHSKAALTPITFLTMNEDLTLSQLLRSTNVTMDVQFNGTKLVGLELVSRNGNRVFEIYNPIRPVSLSVAVVKSGWNSLQLKLEACWDLKVKDKSTLGFDMYMYKRSTGMTLGGELAVAKYGILNGKFDHFWVSTKLEQNLMIRWGPDRMGEIGYSFNVTDKSLNYKKRIVDYGLRVVTPSRSILVFGGHTTEDKVSQRRVSVAWDVSRNPDKVFGVMLSNRKKTTWGTTTEIQSLEISHAAWKDPFVFITEKSLNHGSLEQYEFTIKPTTNTASHFNFGGYWDKGDWTSVVMSVTQPATFIDIQVKYNITEQNKMFQLDYMMYTGKSSTILVTLDKNLESQQLTMKCGDVGKPRTITSISVDSSHGEHSMKAEVLSYQILGKIRVALPYLEVVLRHENFNQVSIICGLPHPKEIIFKASRSQFTKTVNDMSIMVRLNSSNSVSTRAHWRPEILDEIAAYDWLKGSKDLMKNILPSFTQVSTLLRTEIEGHWNLSAPSVKDFTKAFYQFSTAEINLIMNEVHLVGQKIQEFYMSNAFYIKDLVRIFRASFSPLVRIVQSIIDRAADACKTICYYLMNAGKIASNIFIKYYGRLEVLIMEGWENVEQLVVRLWKSNACWLQRLSEELEDFIDTFLEVLEGKVELLESKLLAVGMIKNLINIYRDYATWFDELPIDDYVTSIENFFQIKVWDRLEQLFGPYLEAVRNAMVDEYLQELLQTPPIPYIRFVVRQTKNVFVRLWDFIELEEKVKNLVRHGLRNIDGLMQQNFPKWWLVWDIDNGVFEYDQSLSFFEWLDFTQMPRWRVASTDAEKVNQITNLYYQILDYLENLKPVFDMRIRDILPPFGGLAMMAGDYHYYTFDKKYFRFAGECSYVLVADLLHNGFSFIVNYQTRDGMIRKKSYSIALANHSIEFDVANFKVNVDGRKVELPIKVDTVYIRRQETRLDIYDVRGYQIRCTLSPSVCTFSTSGWYYGKLAGLLGTYDNEPINDFRSPDGQVISDTPTFAYSWRVGKNRNQCRMKNFAKDEVEPVDVDNICYNLLANRNSPLRPCFNTVDTTIFMEMCKYDISKNVNSANRAESACTSMSAYVTECQKHNVDVWMPPTCVRCKLEDGTAFTTGENVTLQTNGIQRPPNSADVVILLEEKDCVDQIDIPATIAKLEASLRAEGLVDNQYALIGFGGLGIHHDAHIQTSSANVWAHSTLLKVPEKVNVKSTRKSDLYSAIHFASTMTYRAGVSKTLIAISCGDDKCGDSVRYADTLTLLVENDIKMHMLTPKPFTLKGKKKQDDKNHVIGFDTNGVYTPAHAKRDPLVADPSFKRHFNSPKDLCTPLAVETNGTRFTTDRPTKVMLDVWARRVAQTAHPSECQRCECVPDRHGGSRLMCHQCVSPSLWKFMEEWKNYQSQEIDDMFGLEILETESFMIPTN